MKTDSDAIIVGGGPCGSFAALNLAKRGVNVTVLEEHSEIGIPCHCPGHLSIRGLKNLGLHPLPEGIVENTFRGVSFHSPTGRKFDVVLASPVTCTVNRVLFDKHIARRAEAAGANFHMNSRVESLIIREGNVEGVLIKQKDGTEEATTRIVVDAEGVSSRLLRQTQLTPLRRDWVVNGVTAEVDHVQDMELDKVEVFLGTEYAPGFYAWLIPRGNGQAKVGLAARRGNPKLLLQKLIKKHPSASKHLRSARILHIAFHPIMLGGPIPRTYSDGFLAVGDAASQVKPTTGGGVILGLTCASLAAKTAHEALCKDNCSAEFLSAYQRRCKEALDFDVRAMLRIREVLNAMSDRQIDAALGFCEKLGLEKVLQRVDDIDHQGRSLLHALGKPRTLAALGYFFYLYLAANP
jgi:geranylgeranyl reductase family protein